MYRFYKNLIKLLIIFYFIKNNNNDINDNEFLTSNFSIILLRKAEMKLSLSVQDVLCMADLLGREGKKIEDHFHSFLPFYHTVLSMLSHHTFFAII